jgi:hypothetical protein
VDDAGRVVEIDIEDGSSVPTTNAPDSADPDQIHSINRDDLAQVGDDFSREEEAGVIAGGWK